LEETDLFQPFSEEAKGELSRHLQICRFPPEAIVMREGEQGDSLFIIAEGTLTVWVTLEDGNSIEIVRRTTGEVIGEIALLTGEPRTATVKAMTDAVLYEISKQDIAPFMESQPELVERLSEILAERKMKTTLAKESFLRQESQKKNLSVQFVHKIQRFFGI
jgi:branched-chain amino acid transport system substrate-binding protein